MATTPDVLETLQTTTEALRSLITHLQSFSSIPVIESNPPNALALLSTSAALLRAQITKLSLLLLNKPFTPTAITHILSVLTTSILPALVTGAQLAGTERYPAFVAREARRDVLALLKEVKVVLTEIPTDERGTEKIAGQGRESLASTGIIWEACDRLIDLGRKGVGGLLASKMEEWKDLLVDAIEEIEEWIKEEVGTADTEAELLNRSDDSDEELDFASLIEAAPSSEVLALFKPLMMTLHLVQKIYPPLLKRRIRRLATFDARTKQEDLPSPELVQKLNAVAEACEYFTLEADEIAMEMYAREDTNVRQRLDEYKRRARTCMETMNQTWDGAADEFSDWGAKWIKKLDEIPESC